MGGIKILDENRDVLFITRDVIQVDYLGADQIRIRMKEGCTPIIILLPGHILEL